MRIALEIKEILDELRKLESDLPSRSEMVRRLIVRAVDPHRMFVKRTGTGLVIQRR
jgi:hypothetical protein